MDWTLMAKGIQALSKEGKKRFGSSFDTMTMKTVNSQKAVGICKTKDGKKHQVTVRF